MFKKKIKKKTQIKSTQHQLRSCLNQEAEKKSEEKSFCCTCPINYQRQCSIWESSPRQTQQLTNYMMVLILPVCQANYKRFFFFPQAQGLRVKMYEGRLGLSAWLWIKSTDEASTRWQVLDHMLHVLTQCVGSCFAKTPYQAEEAESESSYSLPTILLLMCVMTRT